MKNTALEHRCANAGTISNPVTVTLDDQRSYTVSDVPCTSSEICVVPETSHIDVVGLLNVGALVVKGSVSILTTATLCAGYISLRIAVLLQCVFQVRTIKYTFTLKITDSKNLERNDFFADPAVL